ncbi:MAG TPA: hypothetical protein VK982_12835 [Bacteroidales bacterium]|nr:hypothetical protein [Bacteroidales bacterium]
MKDKNEIFINDIDLVIIIQALKYASKTTEGFTKERHERLIKELEYIKKIRELS